MTEEIEIRSGGGPGAATPSASGWSYRPRTDVLEDATGFTILADMPGATAEDIKLSFEDRILTIHGTVKARQGSDASYLVHEFGIGDFDRAFVLSDAVEARQISAEYRNGVLTIHLAKSETAKPRRIPVRPA